MKVLIYGVSGMLGQAALRECLAAKDVERIGVVVRAPIRLQHPKVSEYVTSDLFDQKALEPELSAYDACIYCIGQTAAGMKEAEYSRITHDLTLAVAECLLRLNAALGFVYVSGQGADSTEKGPVMWARVRGRTENDLLRLGPRGFYAMRPGVIQPLHGIKSRTPSYRWFYAILGPALTVLRIVAPARVLSTDSVGKAMLNLLRERGPSRVLESPQINAAADRHT